MTENRNILQTVPKMDHSNPLVILIHGFCRGAKDMQFWRKVLEKDFPCIITPDLPTRYSSFEKCVEILTEEIYKANPEKYSSLYFAGHSMGGLMAREFLYRNKPANAEKLLCVGTPHLGSRLADIALCFPGAGKIWKPLHALKTAARNKITDPGIADLKIGTIVSRNNGHWPGKLFLSKDSDGLVESFSAHAPDAAVSTETAAAHVTMQFDMQTALLIRKFFLEGTF